MEILYKKGMAMIGGLIEGGVALLVVVFGGIFIFGQVKNNAERNAADIKAIKTMMKEYQEDIKGMISSNIKDMEQMLKMQRDHARENLEREVNHLRDLVNMSSTETREDIRRLEAAQRESNKIKERLALAEASLRSVHKRLDIEVPVALKREEE